MARKQEHCTGHRITKRSLIIEGSSTEIALSFDQVRDLIQDLSREFAQDDEQPIVPKPRRRMPILPDKYGQAL